MGGLLTYLLINPSMVAQEEGLRTSGVQAEMGEAIRHVLLLGMVLGMSIGAALVAAEELESRNMQRLGLYTLFGLIVGIVEQGKQPAPVACHLIQNGRHTGHPRPQ